MSRTPLLVRLETPRGRLSAVVAPELGAELCGLEWAVDGGRHQLLYRGLDFSPTQGWAGRAPILWPAIGRTYAPGTTPTAHAFRSAPLGWQVDGASYPMPMHGFARSLPWRIEHHTSASLSLVLSEDDRTRVFYPYAFRLTLDFDLADDTLTMAHRVEASQSNGSDMPFAIGNHATFNTPLLGEASLADTFVSSNGEARMLLDPTGRPAGGSIRTDAFARPTSVEVIDPFDVIPLSSTPARPWAKLQTGALSVRVEHDVAASCDTPEAWTTLWGDPADGYLSLEAWLGKPNALANGDGVCRLSPGDHLTWTLSIGVEQDAAGPS